MLLITEDLEEAIALAGRILVIYEGRIVGEVAVDGEAARRRPRARHPDRPADGRRHVIRLERRLTAPRWLSWAVPLGSLAGGAARRRDPDLVSGNDVVDTYSRIVDRAFGSADAWSATFIAATPLLFTGLAAAIAFRMGVFNIGGEGQFVMGAIAGSWFGLALGDELGKAVIPLMILGGAAAGALWAGIVGVLKTRFNTNEIITSLMLNYVAINIAYYLIFNSRSTGGC